MTTSPKIICKNVKKAFGPKVVLDGFDLEVAEGESLVIIGGSGSGKSVSIKCIIGLIAPDSGSILVDGEEVTKLNRRKREELMYKFGMLFQGGALFDSLPVWENVAFGPMQKKMVTRAQGYDLAVEKLKAVGLSADVAKLSPAELSGGMQKRVSLARAIASGPQIIFFDEPTTGLDPIMADVINDLIIQCTKDLGLTTISITHDMASATKIADKIAMIYQGKIIWVGRAQDIYHSRNPYVDQFVHGRAEGPITAELKLK